MNLIDALENMNQTPFPELSAGKAETVKELWENCVKDVHFPDFNRVKTMFAYLKKYSLTSGTSKA